MDEFVKMDWFFFIASAAAVVLTLLLSLALWYALKILRDVKYITRKAKTEADIISGELNELRQNVRGQGAKLRHLADFLGGIYKKSKRNLKDD